MSCLSPEYSSLTISREDIRYWWAICPFHDDHHPSLSINKDGDFPGWFRCWTCGEQGSSKRFARLTGQTHLTDHQRRTKNAISDFYASKRRKKHQTVKASEKIDFSQEARKYQTNIRETQVEGLASQLGVSCESLRWLGVGFDGSAFMFPMQDAMDKCIGIHRRFPDGKKLCLKGSRLGLFCPEGKADYQTLLICEGVSDTAAALTLGFKAIGRPGCSQCVPMTVQWCAERGISEGIIFSDNDSSGIGLEGAKELCKELISVVPKVKIIAPPPLYKDLRQWLKDGVNKRTIQDLIEKTKAHRRPVITVSYRPHITFKGPLQTIHSVVG